MKRVFAILLVLAMVLSFVPVMAADEEIVVYVNGVRVESDVPAMIYNDRTMLPVRAICEALGGKVSWDSTTRKATVTKGIGTVVMTIDSTVISKCADNEDKWTDITTDVAPMIYNDRTLVPVRALAESLNAVVEWNEVTRTVNVTLEYDWVSDFVEGRAIIQKDKKFGYIDQNRSIVLAPTYDVAGYFSDGLALVKNGGYYGFIDINGAVAIPLIYDDALAFSEGVAVVAQKDMYGFINKKGDVEIPLMYDKAFSFSEEWAMVIELGQYKYINHVGNVVLTPECDFARSYSEGLAVIRRNGKYEFINKSGAVAIPYVFDNAESFEEGVAWVTMDNDSFYIDKGGNRVGFY